MDYSDDDLFDRLKDWLTTHCKHDSKSWQDYERAKAYMETMWFDYTNWDAGIKIITEYLGL